MMEKLINEFTDQGDLHCLPTPVQVSKPPRAEVTGDTSVSGVSELLATSTQTKSRTRWSKSNSKLLFECYIRSETDKYGYRKKTMEIWSDRCTKEDLKWVSEQWLADQVRQIKTKKGLEDLEQDEIEEKIRREVE